MTKEGAGRSWDLALVLVATSVRSLSLRNACCFGATQPSKSVFFVCDKTYVACFENFLTFFRIESISLVLMQTTVLLVDDNEMTAEVQQFTLETLDLTVVVATDGEQALKYLEAEPSVRLVITDMVMPGMDGLELVRCLKASDKLKSTKIILCTGQGDTETARKAAEMGCADCLIKPVHPELLLTTVRNILEE